MIYHPIPSQLHNIPTATKYPAVSFFRSTPRTQLYQKITYELPDELNDIGMNE
jgi:hypothetical protein